VATVHDVVKESGGSHLALVPPSMRSYSVWGFHMSRMCQYIQMLVQQGSTDVSLNPHRRGLPP
jgi:hypothetical protein